MWKSIAGIVVGYLVMFVVVFVILTAAYLGMGTEKAFKPGVFDPSLLWLVVMFVVGLVAAVAGGWVCKAIAGGKNAVLILAALVLVLGLLMAGMQPGAPDTGEPQVRSGDMGSMEAMMSAKSPTWVNILNPIIGGLGVLLGGRLKRDKA